MKDVEEADKDGHWWGQQRQCVSRRPVMMTCQKVEGCKSVIPACMIPFSRGIAGSSDWILIQGGSLLTSLESPLQLFFFARDIETPLSTRKSCCKLTAFKSLKERGISPARWWSSAAGQIVEGSLVFYTQDWELFWYRVEERVRINDLILDLIITGSK